MIKTFETYRDYYFPDADRVIRIALCRLLAKEVAGDVDWKVMDRICAFCPIHRRAQTDLFCVYHEGCFREMCRIAEKSEDWSEAMRSLAFYLNRWRRQVSGRG